MIGQRHDLCHPLFHIMNIERRTLIDAVLKKTELNPDFVHEAIIHMQFENDIELSFTCCKHEFGFEYFGKKSITKT